MEPYHKIQTLFKRDMDGSITGHKGKMMEGQWTTPELAYLADLDWEWTEKVDGTNIRVQLRLSTENSQCMWADYAGRSDNAVIPKPLLLHLEETFPTFPMHRRDINAPSYTARYMDLVHWMNDNGLEKVVLFGEGYGPKIQNGGNYRSDTSFVLFDVKIGDFWLDRANVDDVASKLSIDSVPVIGQGSLHDAIRNVKSYLGSTWGDFEAEGIVARPKVPLFNRKGERIITKIKGVDFR
jgi:hypothetical protein